MSVDFMYCEECSESFCDVGYYFRCNSCGVTFCSDKCGGRSEDYVGNDSCVSCRKESIGNWDLIQFLLVKLNLTYEQATELYKEET